MQKSSASATLSVSQRRSSRRRSRRPVRASVARSLLNARSRPAPTSVKPRRSTSRRSSADRLFKIHLTHVMSDPYPLRQPCSLVARGFGCSASRYCKAFPPAVGLVVLWQSAPSWSVLLEPRPYDFLSSAFSFVCG